MRSAKPGQMPSLESQYFPLVGGLDVESAQLTRKPGVVSASMNYESSQVNGYDSSGNFERFSGQPRPCDAGYSILSAATVFLGVAVGTTVNGETSGFTGRVLAVRSANQLVLGRVTGSAAVGENVRVGTTVVGVSAGFADNVTSREDNTFSALAADDRRADIAVVPGSGPIRGLIALNGVLYAWRDAANAMSCVIWKSSLTGWLAVPLLNELAFTAGSGTAPAEGATITKSGVSAVVRRVVLQSGTWAAGTAAGRFIIDAPTGGAFTAGAFTAGVTATCSGAHTAITLLPAGRVDAVVNNFGGAAGTTRIYGADGMNPGFEFDGTVYVPIRTGMLLDTPRHCFVHRNHLFFAFEASVQHSAIGTPYAWTVVLGAQELAVGADVVGFHAMPGDDNTSALLIFCSHRTKVLYGNSAADWKLVDFSAFLGAQRWSVQNLGSPVSFDALGVAVVEQSQQFGHFNRLPLSARIQRFVDGRKVTASVVARQLNRMRIFFEGGDVLSITPIGDILAFMPINYGRAVNVAVETSINGLPRNFFAGDDGFVYEADVGRSADGAEITAWMKLAFNHTKSPTVKKRFRRVDLEVKARSACSLKVYGEFSMGDPDIGLTDIRTLQADGFGALYDVTAYDQCFYDSPLQTTGKVRLDGVGTSLSLNLVSQAADALPHTLQSVTTLYTPRRVDR